MSTTFQLTTGGDIFDFDLTGAVSKAGAPAGKWTTNTTDQIVLTKADNTTVAFDVTWIFNADNHLVLQSGGADLVDFNNASPTQPLYKTVNAALIVFPDSSGAFNFQLHGTWDLNDQHDLTFTINGVKSPIAGFIQDPRSRFMYHFFDQQDLTRESILGFVGSWSSTVTPDGKPMLQFSYMLEDGTQGTFKLPAAATFNTSINQFMYEYDKEGQAFRIQFVGELQISDKFQITYSLDRQVSRGQQQVASTTFTIGAVFTQKNFTGELQLAIAKNDGTAGGTTITIGGNFTAQLGTAQLSAGFAFSQIRNGATVTTTAAFNGSLKLQDNGLVTWSFTQNATQLDINLQGQIQLGPVRVDSRLNIESQGGRMVGVRVLLGVAF
jgi:hypothetical protein